MDTEFIVTDDAGLQLQILLDCGRISYLHIDSKNAKSVLRAAD
jgi:hypothetical protein